MPFSCRVQAYCLKDRVGPDFSCLGLLNMSDANAEAPNLLGLVSDNTRVIWYGKSVNPAMVMLDHRRVATVTSNEADARSLSKVRYNGRWHTPKQVQSDLFHKMGEGGPWRDICLGCVSRAELPQALEHVSAMQHVAVAAFMVMDHSAPVKAATLDGFSSVSREVLWSCWTKFEATTSLLLYKRGEVAVDALAKLFDMARNDMRLPRASPSLKYPFDPFSGMLKSNEEPEHSRPGPEITYYVKQAKRQRTTAQVPVAKPAVVVLASGPWDGIRQLTSQDFLMLYEYLDGVVNITLLSPAEQQKLVSASLPKSLAEYMYRVAAHSLKL